MFSAFDALAEIQRRTFSNSVAQILAFNMPAISGLGNIGGFDFRLESLGGASPAELALVAGGLVFAANQHPALSRVFSTFTVATPRLHIDIDREKAQALGVPVSDIYNAMQIALGGLYVNDFNLYGRIWQVNVQAEAVYRDTPDDIWRLHVRNRSGEMVPLSSVASGRLDVGPQFITRYN